jgi:hypothetical protein
MRTPGRWLAALLVAAVLAGCGGGPAPTAWAASVCEALTPWRTEIGDLTVRTQQQMTAETTPAQAKENLVRLFGGAHAASEQARAQVERAGVPDVDGGQAVLDRFTASLAAVRDAYGRARDAIAKLDTGQATVFYDRVAEVVAALNVEYGRSALDTTNLESGELKRAFDEVPECH